MKPGVTVVYESTVYPGATEEICIPVLEQASGKQWKRDFSVGYSPERINPGDPQHTLTQIKKVVSGDTPDTLAKVAALYEWIIQPGVHQASSIRAAEAAKVIENTQRDLNIALMNELAILFKKLHLDTAEVLAAASTKWNFMPFKPGLVGGHCIGVDPYYLTHKADQLGYHPQVILAGRRINDSMGPFIAEQTIKQMITHGLSIKGAKVSIAGLTFKENCADLRNSKVVDVVTELKSYGVDIYLTDAFAHAAEVQRLYGQPLLNWDDLPESDVLIAAVPHKIYRSLSETDWRKKIRYGGVFIDIGAAFDQKQLQQLGLSVWRL
jgi:UDP-N-acetyl-D-galactosamine dehydrogenase